MDWGDLLPACWECNSRRQGRGVTTIPLDPSAIEPLDVLGWDNPGAFVPPPEHVGLVNDTVAACGLRRFDSQRAVLVIDAPVTRSERLARGDRANGNRPCREPGGAWFRSREDAGAAATSSRTGAFVYTVAESL